MTTDYVLEGQNQRTGMARDDGTAASYGYDGARTFTYDVENRLLTETGGSAPLSLAYDATGRLFQTTSGSTVTQFLYDGDRLIGEYAGASSTPARRYVHGTGIDEPLVWYEGTTRKWLHADRQGSIVAWSGDTGSTTGNIYAYGPYGEPSTWAGSRFRYTGQFALQEAGLRYQAGTQRLRRANDDSRRFDPYEAQQFMRRRSELGS